MAASDDRPCVYRYNTYYVNNSKRSESTSGYTDAGRALRDALIERLDVVKPSCVMAHESVVYGGRLTLDGVQGKSKAALGGGEIIFGKSPERKIGPGGYHVQWGFDTGVEHGQGGYDTWETRVPKEDPALPTARSTVQRPTGKKWKSACDKPDRGVDITSTPLAEKVKAAYRKNLPTGPGNITFDVDYCEDDVAVAMKHYVLCKQGKGHVVLVPSSDGAKSVQCNGRAAYLECREDLEFFEAAGLLANNVLLDVDSYYIEKSIRARGIHQIHAEAHPPTNSGPPAFVRACGGGVNRLGGNGGYFPLMLLWSSRTSQGGKKPAGERRRMTNAQAVLAAQETERLNVRKACEDEWDEELGNALDDMDEDEPTTEQGEPTTEQGEPTTEQGEPTRECARFGRNLDSYLYLDTGASKDKRGCPENGAPNIKKQREEKSENLVHHTPVFGIVQEYDARAIALRKSQTEWTRDFYNRYPNYVLYKDQFQVKDGVLVNECVLQDLRAPKDKTIIKYGQGCPYIKRYYAHPPAFGEAGSNRFDDGPPDDDPAVAGWQRPHQRYASSWLKDISDFSRMPVPSDNGVDPKADLLERAGEFERAFKEDMNRQQFGAKQTDIEQAVKRAESEISKQSAMLTWMDGLMRACYTPETSTPLPFTSTIMEGVVFASDALRRLHHVSVLSNELREQKEMSINDGLRSLPRAYANSLREHQSVGEYAAERLPSLQRFVRDLVRAMTTVHTLVDKNIAGELVTLSMNTYVEEKMRSGADALPKDDDEYYKALLRYLKIDIGLEAVVDEVLGCKQAADMSPAMVVHIVHIREEISTTAGADEVLTAVKAYLNTYADQYKESFEDASQRVKVDELLQVFEDSCSPEPAKGRKYDVKLKLTKVAVVQDLVRRIMDERGYVRPEPSDSAELSRLRIARLEVKKDDTTYYIHVPQGLADAVRPNDHCDSILKLREQLVALRANPEYAFVVAIGFGADVFRAVNGLVNALYDFMHEVASPEGGLNIAQDAPRTMEDYETVEAMFLSATITATPEEEAQAAEARARYTNTLEYTKSWLDVRRILYRELDGELVLMRRGLNLVTDDQFNNQLSAASALPDKTDKKVADFEFRFSFMKEKMDAMLPDIAMHAMLPDIAKPDDEIVSAQVKKELEGETDDKKLDCAEIIYLQQFLRELHRGLTSDGAFYGLEYKKQEAPDDPFDDSLSVSVRWDQEIGLPLPEEENDPDWSEVSMPLLDADGIPDFGIIREMKYSTSERERKTLSVEQAEIVSNALAEFRRKRFVRLAKHAISVYDADIILGSADRSELAKRAIEDSFGANWTRLVDGLSTRKALEVDLGADKPLDKQEKHRVEMKDSLTEFLKRNGVDWTTIQTKDDPVWSELYARRPEKMNSSVWKYVELRLAAHNFAQSISAFEQWAAERGLQLSTEAYFVKGTVAATVPFRNLNMELKDMAAQKIEDCNKARSAQSAGATAYKARMNEYRAELAVADPIVSDRLLHGAIELSEPTAPAGVPPTAGQRKKESAFFMSVVEAPNIFHDHVRFLHGLLSAKWPGHHLIHTKSYDREEYRRKHKERELFNQIFSLTKKVFDDPASVRQKEVLLAELKKELREETARVDELFTANKRPLHGNGRDVVTVYALKEEDEGMLDNIKRALGLKDWAELCDKSDTRYYIGKAEAISIYKIRGIGVLTQAAQAAIKVKKASQEIQQMYGSVVVQSGSVDAELEKLEKLEGDITKLIAELNKGALLATVDASAGAAVFSNEAQKKLEEVVMPRWNRECRKNGGCEIPLLSDHPTYKDALRDLYHEELAARAARNSDVGFEQKDGGIVYNDQLDENFKGDEAGVTMRGRALIPPRDRARDAWFAPTRGEIEERTGNGLDVQSQELTKYFKGSEMFGPKAAYKNYIVDTVGLDQTTHLGAHKTKWEQDDESAFAFADWEELQAPPPEESVSRRELSIEARDRTRKGGPTSAAALAKERKQRMGPAQEPISYMEWYHDEKLNSEKYYARPVSRKMPAQDAPLAAQVIEGATNHNSLPERLHHTQDFECTKLAFGAARTALETAKEGVAHLLSSQENKKIHANNLLSGFKLAHSDLDTDDKMRDFVRAGGSGVYGSWTLRSTSPTGVAYDTRDASDVALERPYDDLPREQVPTAIFSQNFTRHERSVLEHTYASFRRHEQEELELAKDEHGQASELAPPYMYGLQPLIGQPTAWSLRVAANTESPP